MKLGGEKPAKGGCLIGARETFAICPRCGRKICAEQARLEDERDRLAEAWIVRMLGA